MMIYPSVLIISSKHDFSTDLICLKIFEKRKDYLRLNRDQLEEFEITLNPLLPAMTIVVDNTTYDINNNTLKTIYYRAPTFLREIFSEQISEEEQLYRTQWAAFVRSLILFDKAIWVNHPIATYQAEMKPFQLLVAKRIGFNIPYTLFTNVIRSDSLNFQKIAVKSLDTAIISKDEKEAFIYTTIIEADSITQGNFSAPFCLQEALVPKIDFRVTVIGDTLKAVKIISSSGIDIDWRRYSGELVYEPEELPEEVSNKCIKLVRELNLVFGAIDLIYYQSQFYFIEINPTGEWLWLQTNTGDAYDSMITNNLI